MLIVVINDSRRNNGQDEDVSSDISHPVFFRPGRALITPVCLTDG